MTDSSDGCLLGKRYLLHDRDKQYLRVFDALRKDCGAEPIMLPPRNPKLHPYWERCMCSIKDEALAQRLLLGKHHCTM